MTRHITELMGEPVDFPLTVRLYTRWMSRGTQTGLSNYQRIGPNLGTAWSPKMTPALPSTRTSDRYHKSRDQRSACYQELQVQRSKVHLIRLRRARLQPHTPPCPSEAMERIRVSRHHAGNSVHVALHAGSIVLAVVTQLISGIFFLLMSDHCVPNGERLHICSCDQNAAVSSRSQ